MWKIMCFLKNEAWTHVRLHLINAIKPRKKKTVNHPFKDIVPEIGYITII